MSHTGLGLEPWAMSMPAYFVDGNMRSLVLSILSVFLAGACEQTRTLELACSQILCHTTRPTFMHFLGLCVLDDACVHMRMGGWGGGGTGLFVRKRGGITL